MASVWERQKSVLTPTPDSKQLQGTKVVFQWSMSAVRLQLLEDHHVSIKLPSIHMNQSPRLITDSSPFLGRKSISPWSTSTQRSHYPYNDRKRFNTPVTTENDETTSRDTPLLLSYRQLHKLSNSPLKRETTKKDLSMPTIFNIKQKNVSLLPMHNNKLSRNASMNGKMSPRTKNLTSTLTVIPMKSKKSKKFKEDPTRNNLVRLRTPQLRQLQVSDKYMADAKKLYYNVPCKSFTPCFAVA